LPGNFPTGDSWYLRARDTVVIPPIPADNLLAIASHTTGDPVADTQFNYTAKDNNPNVTFSGFGVVYQIPTDERNSSQVATLTAAGNPVGIPGPLPTLTSFYSDNSYTISQNYNSIVPEYGSGNIFDPNVPGAYQNWVGILSYSIKGDVKDGWGVLDSNHPNPISDSYLHHFATDTPPFAQPQIALERIDNDPPSLRIFIVSQSDNKRWEVKLEENIRDLTQAPTTVANLAKTKVSITARNLTNDAVIPGTLSPAPVDFDGSSNFPNNLNGAETVLIDSQPTLNAAIPQVRRSSRLLINVEVEDNVDYKPFSAVSFSIKDVTDGNKELITAGAPTIPTTQNKDLDLSSDSSDARYNYYSDHHIHQSIARYVVDMPMKVDATQPQVKVEL
ncbi:hypothetical protein HYY75_13010, partial [bacterium]|nr:hypothetical protein [bacterium]